MRTNTGALRRRSYPVLYWMLGFFFSFCFIFSACQLHLVCFLVCPSGRLPLHLCHKLALVFSYLTSLCCLSHTNTRLFTQWRVRHKCVKNITQTQSHPAGPELNSGFPLHRLKVKGTMQWESCCSTNKQKRGRGREERERWRKKAVASELSQLAGGWKEQRRRSGSGLMPQDVLVEASSCDLLTSFQPPTCSRKKGKLPLLSMSPVIIRLRCTAGRSCGEVASGRVGRNRKISSRDLVEIILLVMKTLENS